MNLSWAEYDQLMDYSRTMFTVKTYENTQSYSKLLRGTFSDTQIFRLIQASPNNVSDIVNDIGPDWFPYSILKNTKHKDYPQTFVLNQLEFGKTVEIDDSSIEEVNGIRYYINNNYRHILILRPNEVLMNPKPLLELLGNANDGRYNVLEILGMYHLVMSGIVPLSFINDIWKPLVRKSSDGIELRRNLKLYSTSIKRWPEFWEGIYDVESALMAETETVLGYIITDITEEHLISIDNILSTPKLSYPGTSEQFFKHLEYHLDHWKQTIDTQVRDEDYSSFLANWNAWTTSGSAPEFKLRDDSGHKYRINKSMLPLVSDIGYFTGPKPQVYSKIILKAEVGKSRIAYSTPTYYSMAESYIAHKYSNYLEDANKDMFTAKSQESKLLQSAKFIETNKFLASSDIEKNDFIHITYLDTYILLYMLRKHLVTQEDINVVLSIASFYCTNKLQLDKDYKARFLQYYNPELKARKDRIVLEGIGGLMTGRRLTTLLNSVLNYAINAISVDLVNKVHPKCYSNTFGGDDSIQEVTSILSGILLYSTETNILLTINPTKSYISRVTGEFFRVQYKVGGDRRGYWSRVIHSIIANNPVSRQELDVITKLKGYWSNIQQILRRTNNKGKDYFTKLLFILANVNKIKKDWLSITVENGGCGISVSGVNDFSVLRPGIPRFHERIRKYEFNYNWFDQSMIALNPDKLDGINHSYLNDMTRGIRDFENRRQSRLDYRKRLKAYKPVVLAGRITSHSAFNQRSFYLTSKDKVEAVNILTNSSNIYRKQFNTNIRVQDDKYQYYLDVLNRAKFVKFRDKLNYLINAGILSIQPNLINRFSAYVMQQLLTKSVSVVSKWYSLPPDMTWAVKDRTLSYILNQRVFKPSTYSVLCTKLYDEFYQKNISSLGWAYDW